MKKYLFICLAVLCVVLVGCGKKDSLIGEWQLGSYVFTFNEDKTCSYVRKCTYTVDGDKLSILYEGDNVPYETTFKIEDNKLTIKDSANNDVVYTRK